MSLGLLLAGLLPDAWAQAPAGQVAPDACVADAQCKELADRGQAEYQAQQYEVALVSLREAYAIQPVSWLLFNIGRIYQKLGRADEALAAYRTFLAQSQAVDEGWQREKARIYVEQIDRERAAQAIAVIPATPPLLAQKPIYQKWWFWIIIGGVTAGVVTGLAVGLTLPQTPPAPPGALVFERTF